MSLVAYESSDESDSDVESGDNIAPSTSNQVCGLKNEENSSKTSLFQSLPAPKTRDVVEEENDTFLTVDAQDRNEKQINGDTGKQLRSTLLLPPPSANSASKSNTKNEKVKISVPAMSAFDSDDEEDVDKEPSKKKVKLQPGKSGLFSMLPPPKSNTTSGKIANRLLIPHAVAKAKEAQKRKELPKPVAKPEPSATASDESDDELEPNEASLKFFSIGDQKVPEIVAPVEEAIAVSSTVQPQSIPGPSTIVNSAVEQHFMPSTSIAYSGGQEMDIAFDESQYDFPMVGPERPDDSVLNNEPLELNDEILLKLQGKRRHKQEEINIIDVSHDEQMSQVEEWQMKSLSEEKASHGHRFKGHAPTSQQRRKHQITYLAFQAKERELELKNQWAQNRMTRRQTQSKYGF